MDSIRSQTPSIASLISLAAAAFHSENLPGPHLLLLNLAGIGHSIS